MEFNILGRARLSVNGRSVDLGPANQRRLLALLLLLVGKPVPVDLIVDQLWPGRSRDDVRGGLYSLVSRLRTVLKRAGVPCELPPHDGNAYRLEMDAQLIDYHRFRKRAEAGRAAAHAGDHALATRLLREAIGLWRGRPLEDLDTDWAARRRVQMEEGDHLPALYALIDCSLAQAEFGGALALLGPLMDEHPSDETLALQRMRALDGLGRPAEAVSFYTLFRQRIVTDLGMEPSLGLREAHRTILSRALDNDRPPLTVDRTGPVPWQLPRVDTGITGRERLLATLDDLIFGSVVGQPAPVVALHGMAGVGKTTLAAVWGWLRRDRFPDGCLYIDFYGYTPDQCVSTDDVMARFLETLGIAPKHIPAAGTRRADRLNRELAGRRTLVVLDNVKDPVLVRPVLSAISTCPVLVIGRTMPTGLVRDGVSSLPVPTLSEEDSVALLHSDISRVRVDDDPASVRALTALSGGLPFALKLIGQYAANRPQVRLADIARELDSYTALLRATGDDDEQDSLQSAFLMSFDALSSDAAALFLALGLHPRPSFGRHAASALFGGDIYKTERQLKALTEVHLLEPEGGAHRHRMHDLLHTYSTNRAHRDLSAEQRRDAVERLADFYCRSASNAWCTLVPHSTPMPALPATTNVVPMSFATEDEAFQWFTEERGNLIAVARLAADYQFHEHAWRIPVAMSESERSGIRDDFVDGVHVAVASARAAGNREAEVGILNCLGNIFHARQDYRGALAQFQHALAIAEQDDHPEGLPVSLHNVGSAHLKLGDVETAIRLYQRALELDQQRGDTDSAAWCLHRIGEAHRTRARYDEALRHLHRALAIREEIKSVRGQGDTLIELGVLHRERGDLELARDHFLRALDAYERSHDKVKAARALTVLASVYCDTGSFPESAECAERALSLCEVTGDRLTRARALHVRGRAVNGLGDRDAALDSWTEAADVLHEAGDPEADVVRARLDAAADPQTAENPSSTWTLEAAHSNEKAYSNEMADLTQVETSVGWSVTSAHADHENAPGGSSGGGGALGDT